MNRKFQKIIYFFSFLFVFCSCSKHAPGKQQTSTTQPPPKVDSVGKIPDINKENVNSIRPIELGSVIYNTNYIDQPYIVQLADSSWVCVFTTGPGAEGSRGQHVMATRSFDLGKTWNTAVNIEPQTGPVASWAIPYITSYGRIYVFYDYNGDNITQLNGVAIKNDLLGWYCYKYSDDMGQTWSDRYRIPIKNTSVDITNSFKGKTQMFWGICKPIHTSNGLLFSYTKIGRFMTGLGEGWLLNCPNIDTEKDAGLLQWNLFPGGDVGIKNPAWYLQEEHNLVQLNNGNLYCVNRCEQGFPGYAISADFGNSWTMPVAMRYGDGLPQDRVMKHPLACPRIFKCKNGNYLLWYHNNGTTSYGHRNPAWVSGGVEVNGSIWWSEPEILLYSKNVKNNFSYPDLIEQQGRYFVTETQKDTARVHEIDKNLLNDLWYQRTRKTKITNGLVAEYTATDHTIPANNKLFTPLGNDGGFTIDFMVKLNKLGTVNQIFSNIDTKNAGVSIATTTNSTIAISLNDGTNSISWETDPDAILANTLHHVTFVVDGAANTITVMVDGKLCDGGIKNQFGWTRFFNINNVNTNSTITIAGNLDGQLTALKIYSRALRTSESVSNYFAFK